MRQSHKHLLLLFITLLSIQAQSQQNTRSPYSLFGVGLRQYNGFADNAAVGNNGAAYRFESNFSFTNPASLTALKFSAFNVGAFMDMGTVKTSSISQNFSNAGLGYIALGVPLKKIKSGLAVGIQPYSDVGYNIYNVKDSSGVSISNEFEGRGGLSRLNLGFGSMLGKYISLGVNYSFIFGQIDESSRRRYPGSIAKISYAENRSTYLRGHHLDLGLQFHLSTDSGFSQVLGVVLSNKTKLKGDLERIGYTFNEPFLGNETLKDIIFSDTVSKNLTLPQSLNINYAFGKNEKWQITAGYSKTLWQNYESIFGDNSGFVNDQGYSLGAFYCSKAYDKRIKNDKFKRYVKSIRYSAGYFHQDGYISVNGSQIAENGITFGLGFPFTKTHKNYDGSQKIITSRIFVTGELVRRGTTNNNLIQEDFFRIKIGLNLADSWFNKRQFN